MKLSTTDSFLPSAALGALYWLAGCTPSETRAEDRWEAARTAMVRTQIEPRGITDAAVLQALRSVPRHLFVPEAVRASAYEDRPLPIGADQTISQPYIVAFMSAALRLRAGEKVLEVGTGSGYQAAVLAAMGARVFSIEIVPELARRAEETLRTLGYSSVLVRAGDGYRGWPEEAPFDAILLTAAPPQVPQPLLDQLGPSGRLIAPIGPEGEAQRLSIYRKTTSGFEREELLPVRFVPMTGEAQRR